MAFGPKAFSLILGIALIIAFADVLFGGKTFFFRDFATFGYPLAEFHRQSVWNGEIPLWNPYNNCGLPFLGQWNTLTLYPLSIIYLLLPLSFSLALFCLTHQFIGGLGMYLLARRWTGSNLGASFAGLAFAFGGLTLSCLKWPNNIAALGLMPWVVLTAEKAWRDGGRSLIFAILMGAMQMLSGAPEIILFTWVFIGVLWLIFVFSENHRCKISFRFALLICSVAALSAAQLFPFLQLLAASQRGEGFSDANWSMPLWGWANFLVPLFRCFPSHEGVFAQYGQYWVSSYYPGAAVVGIAFLGVFTRDKRAWLLAGTFVASSVLALGPDGLAFSWVNKLAPISSVMRFPIKFIVLGSFCIPLLAAFGIRKIEATRANLLFVSGIFVVLCILVILAMAYWLPFGALPISPVEQWKTTAWNGLLRLGFLITIFALLFFQLRAGENRAQSLFSFCAIAFLFFDLVTQAPRLNPTVERWVYGPVEPQWGILQFHQQPTLGKSRVWLTPAGHYTIDHLSFSEPAKDVLYSRGTAFANCNLLGAIPKIDGFYALYLPEEQKIESILQSATNRNAIDGLLDFLSVTEQTAPVTSTEKVLDWESRSGALPWITIGQKPLFVDAGEVSKRLANHFLTEKNVLLPVEARIAVLATNEVSGSVKIQQFSAHRVELQTAVPEPAMLVMNQSYYPAWQAFVDGTPVKIWKANLAFQAIEIPAGNHSVSFIYRDRAFFWGGAISIFTLISLCFAFLWIRRGPSNVAV